MRPRVHVLHPPVAELAGGCQILRIDLHGRLGPLRAVGLCGFRRLDLLQANGVRPIDELAWERDVPDTFDLCALVGMPSQFVAVKDSSRSRDLELSKALVAIAADEIPRPDYTDKDRDLFYGQLLGLDGELTDIDGMSGGPIFGFKREDGAMRYWVIALQSGWFPRKRVIFACRIRQLCEVLRRRIVEQIDRDTALSPPVA